MMVTAMRLAGSEIRDQINVHCEIEPARDWTYGCLPESAEILTESGWKKGVNVQKGEKVMSWDSQTESLTLESVEEKIASPFDGEMIALKNDNTDQLLTPNHRVYKKHQSRVMRESVYHTSFEPNWNVEEAGKINRWRPIFLPLSGHHEGNGIGGTDWASLLAWVFTEGGYDHEGTGVRIYQSSTNQDYVDEIAALLKKMVPTHKRYDRVRLYRGREYTESCWFFSGEMALKVRSALPDKHPTWSLLWSMTLEEKEAFRDAALKGDGSVHGEDFSWAFYQKDLGDLEWFQTMLHLVGMQGRVNEKKRCVAVHDNPVTQLQNRHLKKNHLVSYKGTVWCVKVPTGAFMARYNGRIFITGNSGFPKSLSVEKVLEKEIIAAIKTQGTEFTEWAKEDEVITVTGKILAIVYGKPIEIEFGNGKFVKPRELVVIKGLGSALKPAHEPIADFAKGDAKPLEGAPFLYTAKAATKERNAGCEHLFWKLVDNNHVQISKEEFDALTAENEAKKDQEGFVTHRISNGNVHSTVKPIQLCRWLVRLVKMPGDNLILDPFCGSGSIPCACELEDCNYIGIDKDPMSVTLSKARTAYWKAHGKR
jgi:hypothetical protein